MEEAKKVARNEKITLRSLIEEGLRKSIDERRGRGRREFKLRRAAFKGQGLQPHLVRATWDQILDISYEERGG